MRESLAWSGLVDGGCRTPFSQVAKWQKKPAIGQLQWQAGWTVASSPLEPAVGWWQNKKRTESTFVDRMQVFPLQVRVMKAHKAPLHGLMEALANH